MAVHWVRWTLVASRHDGIVTKDEMRTLEASVTGVVTQVIANRARGQSATVAFGKQHIDDYEGLERHDAFAAGATRRLEAIAAWLLPRAAALRALRALEIRLTFLIEMGIDDDQMDLALPAALLLALGEAQVPVSALSNE